MALEQSGLAPTPVDADSDAVSTVGRGMFTAFEGGEDENRVTVAGMRLPRWTRQEILVLILGKRMTEETVRRGRASGTAFGSGHVEPKWSSISSYCKQNGVNRGPIQCRKRWSNLTGDYKKIKEWESQIKDEAESFWAMRSDLRRERKLPGFYDREVYDILDRGTTTAESVKPAGLIFGLAPSVEANGKEGEKEEVEFQAEVEGFFDSRRSAAKDDGLFSDFEHSTQEEAAAGGDGRSDKEFSQGKDVPTPFPISGAIHGTHPTSKQEMGATAEEVRKRKSFSAEGDEETDTQQDRLVEILDRNSRMLRAQLEVQNTHIQLDREQRKDHMDGLVAVLNKLAGALGKIADKL